MKISKCHIVLIIAFLNVSTISLFGQEVEDDIKNAIWQNISLTGSDMKIYVSIWDKIDLSSSQMKCTSGGSGIPLKAYLLGGGAAAGLLVATSGGKNEDPFDFDCVPSSTINCGDSTHPSNTGIPTATGGNGSIEINYFDEKTIGSCPQERTITRNWIATDESGNTKNCKQEITVNDQVSPTADALVELGPYPCVSDIPEANITEVQNETDNCGAVTVSFVGDSEDPGPNGSMIRTYRLTDACGNTTDITQTIIIEDNIVPTADALPDLGPYQCITDIPDANSNDVQNVTDNCGGTVTVTFEGDSGDPGCNGTLTRNYRLTDENGNTADITQTITVEDNIAPTADALTDLGPYPCISDIPEANINEVQNEKDNCSAVTVSFAGDSGDPGQNGSLIRTYRLTDACGNTTDITQTIIVDDNIVPTSDALPNLGPYQCIADIPAANSTVVQNETDNCGGTVTVTFEGDSGDSGCNGKLTRTYRLTDENGNTADITQTITIEDNEAPVFEQTPSNATFQCLDSVPPAQQLTWNDNCMGTGQADAQETQSGTCPITIKRTWTATDSCGNSNTFTQTISVNDTEAPLIICPPDRTITAAESTEPSNTGSPSITDNCDSNPVLTYSDFLCEFGCMIEIVRTWTAMDACGNSESCFQLITVTDLVGINILELTGFNCDVPGNIKFEVTGSDQLEAFIEYPNGNSALIEGLSDGSIVDMIDDPSIPNIWVQGNYKITVTDLFNLCSSEITVFVPEIATYELELVETNSPSSPGGADGYIIAAIVDPPPNIALPLGIYLNGVFIGSSNLTTFTIENLSAGTYSIYIKNSIACPSDTLEVILTESLLRTNEFNLQGQLIIDRPVNTFRQMHLSNFSPNALFAQTEHPLAASIFDNEDLDFNYEMRNTAAITYFKPIESNTTLSLGIAMANGKANSFLNAPELNIDSGQLYSNFIGIKAKMDLRYSFSKKSLLPFVEMGIGVNKINVSNSLLLINGRYKVLRDAFQSHMVNSTASIGIRYQLDRFAFETKSSFSISPGIKEYHSTLQLGILFKF